MRYANHSWKWDEESELGLTVGGGQDYGGVPGKGCKRRQQSSQGLREHLSRRKIVIEARP